MVKIENLGITEPKISVLCTYFLYYFVSTNLKCILCAYFFIYFVYTNLKCTLCIYFMYTLCIQIRNALCVHKLEMYLIDICE